MRLISRLATTALALSTSPLASAHHGFGAHFDVNSSIIVEGTVTEFEFVNPHAFVHVAVTNAQGEREIWWCEMQASSQLRIKGLDENSIEPGDYIRIQGFAARRDPLGCEFGTGYLADGSTLVLRSPVGQSQFSAPPVEDDSGELYGTWFRKAFPGAGIDPDPQEYMTAAGAAANAANDPLVTNPVYNCSAISPVRAWSQPGLPTEIRRDGDTVVIHHAFMDTERVIHLNPAADPESIEPSEMGYSVGRFEDNVLLIETSRFVEGAVRSDFLHTEDFAYSERMAVNPENGDLEVTWRATDPEYYDGVLEGSRILMRTSLAVEPYQCIPGVIVQ